MEDITKFALNSALGQDGFLPLDQLLLACTSIKVQTVTFDLTSASSTVTKTKTIDAIDPTKTIIFPSPNVYNYENSDLLSIAITDITENSITCVATKSVQASRAINFSVQLITFGAMMKGVE